MRAASAALANRRGFCDYYDGKRGKVFTEGFAKAIWRFLLFFIELTSVFLQRLPAYNNGRLIVNLAP